jgi:hypothetical protein
VPDNENSFSRRQIVGSAGLGLAAIAGTVPAPNSSNWKVLLAPISAGEARHRKTRGG